MKGVELVNAIMGIVTSACILVIVGIQLFDRWHTLRSLGILTKRIKYLEERIKYLEQKGK
jgi:hypothetical protein